MSPKMAMGNPLRGDDEGRADECCVKINTGARPGRRFPEALSHNNHVYTVLGDGGDLHHG